MKFLSNDSIFSEKPSLQKGFTLIEVILVMAIFLIMIGFATINLSNSQHTSNIAATVNSFLADMKEQQIKAMGGDTEGRASTDAYGVHIDATTYVLFHGTTYTASDPTNFVIAIASPLQFAPSNYNILFSKGSGEIASSAAIILTDTATNAQKTITLNRYGVITGVN